MLALTHPLEIQRPPIVHFGIGVLPKLGQWVTSRGFARPFIIADAVNATRLSLLGLANASCFGTVKPEPDITNLEEAVAAAEAAGADVIIGFGGGSAMDLAKLVAVIAGSGKHLHDISGPHRAPSRIAGLAQIPTTAGTGSEVGTRALITDPATQNKIATESLHMLADIAIIDPELTATVPPFITAATGIDALAHCVEAFTSRRAHPLIDDYARRGIELVGANLKRAVENGRDMEARSALALASFYGGVCLGPVNTTGGHAIAYPLGTRHRIAHGIANALIFPHVLAMNAPAQPEKTAWVCKALGFTGSTVEEIRKGALTFCEALGLDMRLRAHGVPQDDLAAMAREAHAIRRLLDWNPIDLLESDILQIYRSAW
ncbi:alcohol dehydrogenase [Phyllobacterium phragmitis]|uniref:Alcohol dehydrogenase n=1 Tax=Phyllobacterium phragmitis TaxID=2670329 RepID=A0A2S9IQU2_9HYPH|nr:iron-containing alcohol dehydrogenase [Phyllobacterium phragmitis]PRD42891.1 alcohol dehydrogenase [Phyllobacterium phragmitis]